jgi:hypothetical protein
MRRKPSWPMGSVVLVRARLSLPSFLPKLLSVHLFATSSWTVPMDSREHQSSAPRKDLMRLLLVLTVALTACSGHPSSDAPPKPGTASDGCREYLGAYGACMHRLLPQSPELAQARVEAARQRLDRVTEPARLEQACADGTLSLRASCQ